MNLLQKAYNSIKQIIEFTLFKRKFNNWCENEEVYLLETMQENHEKLFNHLTKCEFDCAFKYYKYICENKEKIQILKEFKNFILENKKQNGD